MFNIKNILAVVLKLLLRLLFLIFYRVEVRGLANYAKAGNRVVIISNHLSFLDAALIATYLPDKPLFAVNTYIANRWYFRFFIALVQAITLDPSNPLSIRKIINEIKQDKKCVIFPEGRITVTGSLMKIYEGPGVIANKSSATILPIRIEGAEYTYFSRLKNVRKRWFGKIILHILPPTCIEVDATLNARQRRKQAGVKLHNLMSKLIFESANIDKTLFESLIDQAKIHGHCKKVIEDINMIEYSYRSIITRAFILGKKIAATSQSQDHLGIMLPNTVNTVLLFFSMLCYGRIPAMLNFSAGSKNLKLACLSAQVTTIYTSRKFIDLAKLHNVIADLTAENISIIYLEDIAKSIGLYAKIRGSIAGFLPKLTYHIIKKTKSTDHAVILFTSGSEGAPKGVVLSHRNLQANREQLAARIDFGPSDIVFNALPLFHSFGLTAGTLLPLLAGIKVFLYPSPLHYRIIPELVYDRNATILFGTNTFLAGYAKYANPYDFYAIRYVFAGAEKLSSETRNIWVERFGLRVLEGYGTTETSPVLSINTPMHFRLNTVGRLLPGITYNIKKVPGIKRGGRLVVQGPNIMCGYFLADNPGVLVPPLKHSYDTGDIVDIDEDGYITILGRAKRFAKIAGEMVSLTAVEKYLAQLWPDHDQAVVNIPDAKKGEAIILVTTNKNAKRPEIIAYASKNGLSELMIPKKIVTVDSIPVLATGKTDYVSLKKSVAK